LPRGGFSRGYGFFGWGRGFGNPYPFCRWFPWLPRRWWAYPLFGSPYYGAFWGFPYYAGYRPGPYPWPYTYLPYGPY